MGILDDLYAQAVGPRASGGTSPQQALGLIGQLASMQNLGTANSFNGSGLNLPTGGSATLQRFLNIAKKQMGDPYVFATQGPNAFDCSGLVSFALDRAGINVGRQSARGFQSMFSKSAIGQRNQLQPGDLMFYWYGNDRGIGQGTASHVDIYLGNGKSIGAAPSRGGVGISNVDWSAWLGGARVPGLF